MFNALLGECEAARRHGDGLEVSFLPGCSLLPHGRNELVQQFMESEADRLVFVDDDMSWEPGSLVRLAHHAADIVGGAGRAKEPEERYCVNWLDRPELWSNELGLIEVKSLGAAFLAISRSAIERLREQADRTYIGDLDRVVHCHFYVPFVDGVFHGEDAAFCRDWRAAGGTLWLDPEVTLTHWDGNRPYKGNIGNWLKARTPPRDGGWLLSTSPPVTSWLHSLPNCSLFTAMDLKHNIETLLGEHVGLPLADYLTGCLNAYEPNSWQQAVAIRKQWDARHPERLRKWPLL